jgi:hypothetical protein
MPVAKLWPSVIATLVPMRRGEDVDQSHLEFAWHLGSDVDEPLRRLGVLAALAEVMWMTGVPDERVTEIAVADVVRLADVPGVEWALGDLAGWLRRLGLIAEVPSSVAAPYRWAVDGRYADAAAWWRSNGEPFSEAMTLSDSPDPADQARAVALLLALGLAGTAARLQPAGAGSPVALPSPRASGEAEPAPLG